MVNTIKFSQFQEIDLATGTNELVGVSSPISGTNRKVSFPLLWDASTQPIAPTIGTLGYNTSLGQYEYWNGIAWTQLAAGGSGSVNVGSQNEMAYYANNGSAVSGLLTQPNSGLITDALGAPGWALATGTGSPVLQDSPILITPTLGEGIATSIEFVSDDGIIGTTSNTNASIGSVGETVPSVITFGSAISILSATPKNLTSILLHPGDWDIWANVTVFSAGDSMTQMITGINTITNTIPDLSLCSQLSFTATNMSNCGLNAPILRASLAAPTTYYLAVSATFSSSTATMCGGLYARVRR